MLLIWFVLFALSGCSTQTASIGRTTDGNLAADDDLRLRRVAARLKVAASIRCQVLEVDEPGAFAWRDRKIAVTRGLMRIAGDDEIAAAIAHEVGHLIHDGHLPAPAALSGDASSRANDLEAAADAMGVQILQASGISPHAMPSLLLKLKAHIPNRQLGRSIERRVKLLQGP